jgi:hypothetical protein
MTVEVDEETFPDIRRLGPATRTMPPKSQPQR